MARTAPIQNDKLLQRLIREAKAPSLLRIDDGLYLQVSASRSTSWKVRYQLAGKRRDTGIGAYPQTTLAEARERASDIRKLVRNGTDPIAQRQAEQKAAEAARIEAEAAAVTFRQVAEQYIEAHRAGWRNAKHAWQWTRTLEMFVYPQIGEKPVSDINTADVLAALTPIWTTKPETATRVRSRIELVLAAATARGQRTGANPAIWRNHLDRLLPDRSKVAKVVHQPAMPWQELPEFWPKLAGSPDVVARALSFVILTAARTGEVLGARWSEIDLEARVWRVPGERMKAAKPHVVPLSDAALAILLAQRGTDPELLFPGRRIGGKSRPLSNMALLMRLRRLRPGVVVHGFRSAFRDWCSEETHHPHHVAEAALAHVVADKVEAAYRRGDLLEKRRALMADWSAYVTAKPAGNVIVFPKSGASSG